MKSDTRNCLWRVTSHFPSFQPNKEIYPGQEESQEEIIAWHAVQSLSFSITNYQSYHRRKRVLNLWVAVWSPIDEIKGSYPPIRRAVLFTEGKRLFLEGRTKGSIDHEIPYGPMDYLWTYSYLFLRGGKRIFVITEGHSRCSGIETGCILTNTDQAPG